MPAADQPDRGRLHALTRLIVSRRTAWVFALVPLVLGGVLLGLVGEVERETRSQDNLPDDSQTSLAAQLLQDLPEKEGSTAIVAVTSDEALDQQELDRLAPEPGGARRDRAGRRRPAHGQRRRHRGDRRRTDPGSHRHRPRRRGLRPPGRPGRA